MNGIEAARAMLDQVGVRKRLQDIRDYLWRGGEVAFEAQPASVAYVLSASWDTAVLEPVREQGLVAHHTSVVDGCWRRRRTGYALRVGIDVHVLTAISITAPGVRLYVPFVDRSADEVAHALEVQLAQYGQTFLDGCLPVPQAVAAAETQLRAHGL
jgi:hypothetical protein